MLSDPTVFQIVLLLISVAAGTLGSIVGLGGGMIVIPALTLLFGVNIHYAIGASIVSVIATSSGAAATYVRDHITNIRVAMLLEVATSIGAICGAALSASFNAQVLFLLFSAILLYSAYTMGRDRDGHLERAKSDPWAEKLKLNSSYPDAALGKEIAYQVTGVPLAFCLMIGAGAISGLLGIGSGALKVPAMDRAMRLPIKVSSATSNFMIGVTAAASAGAYYMKGDIIPFIAAPVALGVFLGAQIGTTLMTRMHASRVRKLFILLLFFISFQMGLKGLGISLR